MIREKHPEDYNRDPYEVAKERGLEVILPPPPNNVITLDIDDGEWEHRARMCFASELLILKMDSYETTSPSGNGLHVYIKTFRDLTDIEKITTQAAMGSDYKREFYCLARHLEKRTEFPNLLMFETPDNATKVRAKFEEWTKQDNFVLEF